MYKIAAVGDSDSVLGFSALGIDIFAISSAEEGDELIARLAGENYAIIYLTENFAQNMKTIEKYKDSPVPAIILIPPITGSLGLGMDGIKKSAERAVGADILFGE